MSFTAAEKARHTPKLPADDPMFLPERGAPRVRLLGLSYILVFGSAMVQIIAQPRGQDGEILGGLMVLGGLIVIVVVFLEARASRKMV